MGGGIPALRSGHRLIRLRHYITFRKTNNLLTLDILLVRPPPLITKPYALLLPISHDCRGYWPPLLCHHNVQNCPYRNVLGHNVATAGGVIPNSTHPRVCYHLSKGGVLPLYVLVPMYPSRSMQCYLIMYATQNLQNAGRYDP